MALISIPSSIGGVTIPGTASNGPLGALFGSQYGLSSLQYPRDLGSMTKGHVVQFSLFERKQVSYDSFTKFSNFAANPTTETGLAAAESAVGDVSNIAKTVTSATLAPNSSVLSLSKQVDSKPEIISLYMPDTVNFTNQASYSGTSVMGAIGEALALASKVAGSVPVIGNILGGLASVPGAALSALNSNPAKLILATQGLALNPKNQLLFEGIDFRTYQMAFVFTPYSAEEARTVKKIIQAFKKHAAPRIVTEAAGMFFVPPSTVKLQFMFNGRENPYVAKVTESVIESVDVNYAPLGGGWTAHDDGAPVQTMLTLNLKEIQLIDRAMIEKQGF